MARGIVAGVSKDADAGGGGVARNAASATRGLMSKMIPPEVQIRRNVERREERSRSEGKAKIGVALSVRTVVKKEMLWTGVKTMR